MAPINAVYQYSDEWATPQSVFDALDREFNFWVDLAATHDNAKCPIYLTKEIDGLKQDWSRYRSCFVNPPFGPRNSWLPAWIEKAAMCGTLVVMILPAKTDVRWFHDFIWDGVLHRPKPGVQVRFPRGRIAFEGPDKAKQSPPGGSMIVVFGAEEARP